MYINFTYIYNIYIYLYAEIYIHRKKFSETNFFFLENSPVSTIPCLKILETVTMTEWQVHSESPVHLNS